MLMRRARLVHFCIWITAIIAVFELTNLFIRLWTYTFAVPSLEYFVVAFVAPLGLTIVIAAAWQLSFGYRFFFIDNLIRRDF